MKGIQIATIFALMLVMSVFANGFALAADSDEDSIVDIGTVDEGADVEVESNENIDANGAIVEKDLDDDADKKNQDDLGTAAGELPIEIIEAQFDQINLVTDITPEGATRAYYGHGWATSGDEGYIVQALWMRNNVENLDEFDDQERRIAMMGGGLIRIGVGSQAKVFRLVKTESPEDEINFDLRDFDGEPTATPIKMGTLHLARNPYSDVSKWEGHLILHEPSRTPVEYDVEIGTRSIEVDSISDVRHLKVNQDKKDLFGFMPRIRDILKQVHSIFD